MPSGSFNQEEINGFVQAVLAAQEEAKAERLAKLAERKKREEEEAKERKKLEEEYKRLEAERIERDKYNRFDILDFEDYYD
jgi:hypothetical protein